jgi:phosphatidylglycerophosphatase A
MSRIARAALTVGGLGLLRPAPGTWGSLPPVVLGLGMVALGAPTGAILGLLGGLVVLGSLACLRYGDQGEAIFGKKDPGAVVADETAGQALVLLALPWPADLGQAAVGAFVAFVLFRIADIVKPWPAGRLQRIPGGAGILIDDLVAGLYAAIAAAIVVRWLVA